VSDFPARARDYSRRVLSGEQVACKWVKAACRRFLDDLELAAGDWPYRFDETKAIRACEFVECLPHIEGTWKSSHLVLEDWQVFILCNLFGWLHKSNGLRRFRRYYLEVARKNGKSPLGAAILLYMTFADGEPGAQVYSFATKKEQAKIVWKCAQSMVAKEPDFAALGAAYNSTAIYCVETSSSFKPLAKKADTEDGYNTHAFLADELHAHKTRDMFDVMDSSTGARSQPLGGAITTAGSDQSGICFEIRDLIVQILNTTLARHGGLGYEIKGNSIVSAEWFGIIFTLDDGDDWRDEACWIKANPNLSVSVNIEDLRSQVQRAIAQSSAVNGLLTKRFNIWTNAATAWLNMLAWNACANAKMREADFRADECIVGLDLASKIDFVAKVKVYRRGEKYALFSKFYLPESAVEESKNSALKGWVRDGWVNVTPGNVTDFNHIQDDLKADCAAGNVLEVPHDPWQAAQLASNMLEAHVPMVEYGPTVKTMSEPMKELEALVLSRRLEHDGNPAMTWMMANVTCRYDAKDNIYPRKERPENKIDGPVAAITAIGRWLTREPAQNLDDFINAPVKSQ
jgi:phage terminase large subunit-like protein